MTTQIVNGKLILDGVVLEGCSAFAGSIATMDALVQVCVQKAGIRRSCPDHEAGAQGSSGRGI